MYALWLWFVGWGWLYAMIAMSVVLVVQMAVARQRGKPWERCASSAHSP